MFRAKKIHPSEFATIPEEEVVAAPASPTFSEWKIRSTFDWEELLEDFDVTIEERAGTKSSLYRLKGEPVNNQPGIALITEEVMKAYGLEFLTVISEIVTDGLIERRVPLNDMLEQMRYLNYNSSAGSKLLIWVDDGEEEDMKTSFGRLLLKELLTLGIEPEVGIACHDLDDEVLLAIIQSIKGSELTGTEEEAEEAKDVILKLLRIGLSLSLAATRTQIIFIDGDKHVQEDFLKLLDFAGEVLGHTVLYLRNPVGTDKPKALKKFIKKIIAWTKRNCGAPASSIFQLAVEKEENEFMEELLSQTAGLSESQNLTAFTASAPQEVESQDNTWLNLFSLGSDNQEVSENAEITEEED